MDIFPRFMSYLYRPHAKVASTQVVGATSKMHYYHAVSPAQSIAARLLRFSEMNPLKKIAVLVIASGVVEEETIANLTQEFKSIDAYGGGSIDLKDLIQFLRYERCLLKPHQIQHLMDAADLDKNGTLDSIEFLSATLPPQTIENERNVVAAFKHFDTDRNGVIELSEVYNTCKKLNLSTSMEELKAPFSEADKNGDGVIDLSEFTLMMRGAAGSSSLPGPNFMRSARAAGRAKWLAWRHRAPIVTWKEPEKSRRKSDHGGSAQQHGKTSVCTKTSFQFQDADKLRWLEMHTDVQQYSRQNVDVELAHEQELKTMGIPTPNSLPKSASLPSISIGEDIGNFCRSILDQQYGSKRLDICTSNPKLVESPSTSFSKTEAGASVVFAGHRVPSGKMEFFFLKAEDMAQVVGVGLQYAKVEVSPELEVNVIGVEKKEWNSVWALWGLPEKPKMQAGVGQFYFGAVDVSCQDGDDDNFSEESAATPEHLSDEQMARTVGVSLKGGRSAGTIMLNHLQKPQDDGTEYNVPLTFALVKQFLQEVGNSCRVPTSTVDGGPTDQRDDSAGTETQQQTNLGGDPNARVLSPAMGDLRVGDKVKGKQPSKEACDEELEENMLKVTVRPNPGGVFYKNKTEKVAQPPNQELKEASISPKIVFRFIKKGKFDKKMDIRLKPMFNLNGVEPDNGKANSFGWYQDRIRISMSCAQAYLTKPPSFDEKEDIQVIDLTRGSTTSNSITGNASTQVQISFPPVISVRPQVGVQGSHGQGTQSQQTTHMATTEILRGFNTMNKSDLDGGRLEMYMIFARELTPNIWASREVRQAFAQSGICQNLRPTIRSTWRPKNDVKREPYFFSASRDLTKYQRNGNNTKETFNQHFDIQMFVNHEMSHLKTKVIPMFPGLKEGEQVTHVIEVSNPMSF